MMIWYVQISPPKDKSAAISSRWDLIKKSNAETCRTIDHVPGTADSISTPYVYHEPWGCS